MHPDAWLVVIDPQRIFASPDSEWGSPMFPDIVEPVRRLASAAGESRHVLMFNCGLTRAIGPMLQLDCGVNIGLTSAAPDLGVFAGFSRKF